MSGTIERIREEDRLKGVRGWLLLPPVIVVIQIVMLVLSQVSLFANAPSDDPTYFFAIVEFAVLVLVFCAIGVVGTVKLFREKKSARIWMLIYFGLLILFGLDAPIGLMAAPGFDTLLATLWRFVLPVAMVLYFVLSRRVKLTLVN